MEVKRLFIVLVILFALKFLYSIPEDVMKLEKQGEFTKAQEMLKGLLKKEGISEAEKNELSYEIEKLDRIRIDYDVTTEEIMKQLKEDMPDVTKEDMQKWMQDGSLEYKIIDGQTFFFGVAKRNLYRMNKEVKAKRDKAFEEMKKEIPKDEISEKFMKYIKEVIEEGKKSDTHYVCPKRFRVDYTLTVNPDIVPAGELIRCWLLFPREITKQKDMKVISATPENYEIAPADYLQRTVYFEQPAAEQGKPTIFNVVYEFTGYGYYNPIDPAKIKPYDENSELFKKYTAERKPHLTFTPELQKLAKEIVGDEKNPYLKAKKIWEWICKNITYTTAIEYSTILNISGYCYDNKRGDCGIQGMLFIVLCRISGVPAKWQSGWSFQPEDENMHDWAEFYVEPYGWLLADPSKGYIESENPEIKYFNFGNTDAYRLIANDDYGMELFPPNKFFRSEPVDFQRGEVEWKGGNLYFGQWKWKMKIEEVEKGK